MNPQLKEALDKICKEIAVKYSTSEKLVNIFIQIQIAKAKIQTISTFATSKHIDIPDACQKLLGDVVNIAIVAGALAGIEDTKKLMDIYSDTDAKVQPTLQINYMQGPTERKQ